MSVIDHRGSAYFTEEKKLYRSLKAGDAGERKVMDYLQKFGHPNWVILRNVWLNHFGAFECDIILITLFAIYVLEIKNYTGTFTYENGKCYFGEAETKLNPIEQVRTNKVDLQAILTKRYPHLPIKAAVIFAGDDNEVVVKTPVSDINIVSRTGIRRFIEQIAQEEQNTLNRPLEPAKILALLEPCEIPNPFIPSPLTPDEMKYIAGGIRCADCHSTKLQTSKFYITCNCGLSESREEAVLRTICEYGVLTYTHNISRRALVDFFQGQVSLTLLKSTIREHLEVIKKGRSSYCVNKNVLYEKLTPAPHIKRVQIRS